MGEMADMCNDFQMESMHEVWDYYDGNLSIALAEQQPRIVDQFVPMSRGMPARVVSPVSSGVSSHHAPIMVIVNDLIRAGYGWRKFAESVRDQNKWTDKQIETLRDMHAKLLKQRAKVCGR